MDIKENNYIMDRKLEHIKSMLMIIKNDINNSNGAVSEDVLYTALDGVIDYLDSIKAEIEI